MKRQQALLDRLPIVGRAVKRTREAVERFAKDIGHKYVAKIVLTRTDAAIKAVVPIVSHHEYLTVRNSEGAEGVAFIWCAVGVATQSIGFRKDTSINFNSVVGAFYCAASRCYNAFYQIVAMVMKNNYFANLRSFCF